MGELELSCAGHDDRVAFEQRAVAGNDDARCVALDNVNRPADELLAVGNEDVGFRAVFGDRFAEIYGTVRERVSIDIACLERLQIMPVMYLHPLLHCLFPSRGHLSLCLFELLLPCGGRRVLFVEDGIRDILPEPAALVRQLLFVWRTNLLLRL